jgi:dihydrofolate reductase
VRRLVLKMSMTLDGYVAGPDDAMDWVMRTRDPEGMAWVEETLWEAGAHLMGRRTYADMVSFWPTSSDPLAAPMNEIPKIAFSRSGELTLETTTALRNATDAQRAEGAALVAAAPGWEQTRVLGADLASDIEALKAEPGKDLLAHGGVSFGQALVQTRLVDEYRLVVYPVVLGAGRALFAGADPFDLTLIDARTFPSGVQALSYRPA